MGNFLKNIAKKFNSSRLLTDGNPINNSFLMRYFRPSEVSNSEKKPFIEAIKDSFKEVDFK